MDCPRFFVFLAERQRLIPFFSADHMEYSLQAVKTAPSESSREPWFLLEISFEAKRVAGVRVFVEATLFCGSLGWLVSSQGKPPPPILRGST